MALIKFQSDLTLNSFVGENYKPSIEEYFYDGWKKKDGSRFVLRKKLGLDSNVKPGFLPGFLNRKNPGNPNFP